MIFIYCYPLLPARATPRVSFRATTVLKGYSRGAAVGRLGFGAMKNCTYKARCNHKSCRVPDLANSGYYITALRRCRHMAAEPAVAAGAASGANGGTEAKGDDAGVQSLRSSPLPPPFQQREPAASISPLARSSTGSPLERDVPLSQTVQPADSSTSKGAARPPGRLARACSRQKLDISSVSTKSKPSGEDPEATFQVCATRWLRCSCFTCSRVFPATVAAASLSRLPTASLLPLCHGSCPQCAAPPPRPV